LLLIFRIAPLVQRTLFLPNNKIYYRLGLQNYKLFLILQLFLEFFFKKLSNLRLINAYTDFCLNWDGKSTAFFIHCKRLIKLFFVIFSNTFIINLFNIEKK